MKSQSPFWVAPAYSWNRVPFLDFEPNQIQRTYQVSQSVKNQWEVKQGPPLLKIKLWVSEDWESLVNVYENDTAVTVAERCLKPEFKDGSIPKELVNELAIIVQMKINNLAKEVEMKMQWKKV